MTCYQRVKASGDTDMCISMLSKQKIGLHDLKDTQKTLHIIL